MVNQYLSILSKLILIALLLQSISACKQNTDRNSKPNFSTQKGERMNQKNKKERKNVEATGENYQKNYLLPKSMQLVELDENREKVIIEYCQTPTPYMKVNFQDSIIRRQTKTDFQKFKITEIQSLNNGKTRLFLNENGDNKTIDLLIDSTNNLFIFQGFNDGESVYVDYFVKHNIRQIVHTCY